MSTPGNVYPLRIADAATAVLGVPGEPGAPGATGMPGDGKRLNVSTAIPGLHDAVLAGTARLTLVFAVLFAAGIALG